MKRHTLNRFGLCFYLAMLALTSYFVTPWVWVVLFLTGYDAQCGCEECQNIENSQNGEAQ